MARTIGQHVQAFSLAVLRIGVDDRLAQRRSRHIKRLQPEVLDSALTLKMVCIEMAPDANVIVVEVKIRSQEANEKPHQVRVGVRKLELVAILAAFRPVE